MNRRDNSEPTRTEEGIQGPEPTAIREGIQGPYTHY